MAQGSELLVQPMVSETSLSPAHVNLAGWMLNEASMNDVSNMHTRQLGRDRKVLGERTPEGTCLCKEVYKSQPAGTSQPPHREAGENWLEGDTERSDEEPSFVC